MRLVVTGCAWLTAAGEGQAGEPVWGDYRGHRAAIWPGEAAAVCPEISPKAAQRDRACAHALLVARRLLGGGQAGDPLRVGVVLGTALGCGSVCDAYHRGLVELGPPRASPMLFGYTVPSAPVGEVALAHGLRGHQLALMAGRCSGFAAVAEARRALRLGRADAVVVLASDALSPDRAALLGQQGEPAPVEASAALLIETEAHARQRGRAALVALLDAGLRPAAAGERWSQARTSYLGASGVIELCQALSTRPPGPATLELSAEDRGQVGFVVVEHEG